MLVRVNGTASAAGMPLDGVLDLFFYASRRLVHFPYVLMRLRCASCKRAGSYRLVRLAVKYGAEILLEDLLVRLSADCPWRTIAPSLWSALRGHAAATTTGPSGRA
jgi:hypothetical protein